MTAPNFKLDTNAPTVSWADPKNGDSASTGSTSQVPETSDGQMIPFFLVKLSLISYMNFQFHGSRSNLYMSKTCPRMLLKGS